MLAAAWEVVLDRSLRVSLEKLNIGYFQCSLHAALGKRLKRTRVYFVSFYLLDRFFGVSLEKLSIGHFLIEAYQQLC